MSKLYTLYECSDCKKRHVVIRTVWHSHLIFMYGVPFLVGLVFMFVQFRVLNTKFNLWLSLLSVAWAFFGWVVDTYSTNASVKLKPRFDKLNIEFPLMERNPLLPEHPSLYDQTVNLATFFEVLVWIVAFALPVVGIALGTAHLLAATSNAAYRSVALSILEDQALVKQ